MRSKQQLIHLFKEADYRIRQLYCPGCHFKFSSRPSLPSQQNHSICLTDQDVDVYTPKVIRYLLSAENLSWDEFICLQRALCFETPIY